MSNGTMEGALDTVSSQVSEAFGRLTHLQEELRVRLQTVAERERSVEDTTRVLDELAKQLDARKRDLTEAEEQARSRSSELARRAADAEEAHRQREATYDEREARIREREAKCDERDAQCAARDARVNEREARLARREDVVNAFQEMLAQMHTALETLEPDSIMAALDAGAAYEDGAKHNRASVADTRSVEESEPAKDPIGLTPEEQARFFALRDAGKEDAEILAEIYAARATRAGTHA